MIRVKFKPEGTRYMGFRWAIEHDGYLILCDGTAKMLWFLWMIVHRKIESIWHGK